MPTTITSAGITFNDATTLTSATIPANAVGATQIAANAVGATQIANGSVTAAKLGTTEQKQIAKAWVSFNGTTSPGTIRSNYNVSSVTKNAAGDYTVNFATAMNDNLYSWVGSVNDSSTAAPFMTTQNGGAYSTTQIRVRTWTFQGGAYDAPIAAVVIFGN